MLDILYKSTGSFAACLIIDNLFGVQNDHSPILNFHSRVGPLTRHSLLIDVIVNPSVSYLCGGLIPCTIFGLIPYALFGWAMPKDVMIAITTMVSCWGGFMPIENKFMINLYNGIYAMSFGYMAGSMITSGENHTNIILTGMLHNALCSFYWYMIGPSNVEVKDNASSVVDDEKKEDL